MKAPWILHRGAFKILTAMSNKRLPIVPAENTFFIADTHFGHSRCIEMCNRPFSSVYDMDKTLIANWNNTLRHDSVIYFLGDLSFHSRGFTEKILRELKGNKIMVLGNHDKRGVSFYSQFFKFVCPAPIALIPGDILLSHEPIANCPMFNIYGHVHNHPEFPAISETGACVSVEKIGYKPISLAEINEKRNSVSYF